MTILSGCVFTPPRPILISTLAEQGDQEAAVQEAVGLSAFDFAVISAGQVTRECPGPRISEQMTGNSGKKSREKHTLQIG